MDNRNTYTIKAVREDGKTFEKRIKATDRHDAYKRIMVYTPRGWANGMGVEFFVDDVKELGNF